MQIRLLKYWGYVHTNGNLCIKRYIEPFSEMSIEDARYSPFVEEIFTPFKAKDMTEAIEIAGIRHSQYNYSGESDD